MMQHRNVPSVIRRLCAVLSFVHGFPGTGTGTGTGTEREGKKSEGQKVTGTRDDSWAGVEWVQLDGIDGEWVGGCVSGRSGFVHPG